MSGLVLKAKTVDDLREISNELLNAGGKENVFAFFGEMGVGKTTLIKAVCNALQVEDEVSSPTFSLVNEYRTKQGNKIYHFDFYRIKNEEEAFDIGFEEYVYSGNYCFIEWPEKILNLLPQNYVRVQIDMQNQSRIITIHSRYDHL